MIYSSSIPSQSSLSLSSTSSTSSASSSSSPPGSGPSLPPPPLPSGETLNTVLYWAEKDLKDIEEGIYILLKENTFLPEIKDRLELMREKVEFIINKEKNKSTVNSSSIVNSNSLFKPLSKATLNSQKTHHFLNELVVRLTGMKK